MTQPTMFDVPTVVQSNVKTKGKKAVRLQQQPSLIPMEQRGLNGVYKNFGEWIEKGRNNKYIPLSSYEQFQLDKYGNILNSIKSEDEYEETSTYPLEENIIFQQLNPE